MDILKVFGQIHSFILNSNLKVLIWVPIFVGWAIELSMLIIWPKGYNGTHVQDLWISLGFFCMSLSSIPKFVRRESITRTGRPFNGKTAILDGIIWFVLYLALASVPFIVWNR